MKVSMSIREKMDATSGVVTYKTFEHPTFGTMRIRSLTEREYRMGYSLWFRGPTGETIPDREQYGNAKLIQMCLVEDDGSLVYQDTLSDLEKIVQLREADIIPLHEECWNFNRYSPPKN